MSSKHRLVGAAGRLQIQYRRYAVGALLGSSLMILVLGQLDSRFIGKLEAPLLDAVATLVSVVNVPLEGAGMLIRDFDQLRHARQENLRLQQEVARLQGQVEHLQRTEGENAKLRELLALVPAEGPDYVSVRVVAAGTTMPRRSIIIDGGASNGIRVGDPVLSLGRMVGHVTLAGARAARVRLLTDVASHVPVFGERSGQSAVISGSQTSGFLRLEFVDSIGDTTGFLEREAIYTSGQGGMFPPDLLIGQVERGDTGLRVRPAVDIEGVRYLQVLLRTPAEAVAAEQLL